MVKNTFWATFLALQHLEPVKPVSWIFKFYHGQRLNREWQKKIKNKVNDKYKINL